MPTALKCSDVCIEMIPNQAVTSTAAFVGWSGGIDGCLANVTWSSSVPADASAGDDLENTVRPDPSLYAGAGEPDSECGVRKAPPLGATNCADCFDLMGANIHSGIVPAAAVTWSGGFAHRSHPAHWRLRRALAVYCDQRLRRLLALLTTTIAA